MPPYIMHFVELSQFQHSGADQARWNESVLAAIYFIYCQSEGVADLASECLRDVVPIAEAAAVIALASSDGNEDPRALGRSYMEARPGSVDCGGLEQAVALADLLFRSLAFTRERNQ